jgi:hypothetical protein
MTDETLREVCAYILWARGHNLTLNFTPSYDDEVSCAAIGDIDYYGISYGIPDLWRLGAYEFINQLYEITLKFTDNYK